jgi:hypothetical protein
MAHIKTKQPAQFQQISQQRQAGVGATYGERKANTPTLPQGKPLVRKHVDQFSRENTPKASTLTQFNANAAYKSSLKRFVGVQPRAVHLLENGMRPPKTISEAKNPSDDRILNFLDKVIANPALKDASSIRNQTRLAAGQLPAKATRK